MHHPQPAIASRARAAALIIAMGVCLSACRSGDSATMMNEARQYRDQGDVKAAVIQLKNVLQHDADNRAARIMLAELYMDQSEPQSAEKELRRALALGADSGNVALMLGRALLMQGQYDRVLADIGIDAAPAQRPALLALRGDALLGQNKIDEARELYNQALKLHADTPSALLGLVRIAAWQQQPDTARTLLARALAANPDDIACLRYHADLLRADGKADAALQVQQKILRRRPQQVQALIDVANIHIDAGHVEQARKALQQAARVAGPSVGLLYSQAMLDYREHKYTAALDTVQRVLRAAPEHYPSVLLAGAVQSALGAHQQAELHLRTFLQAYPRHLYASKMLAAAQLATDQHEAALALLHPLLAEHPDDADLLALSGEAFLRARDFDAAAAAFDKASALQPNAASLRTGLALSRLGNGDHARAVDELERAASLDGNSSHTGVLLVMAYLRANMTDKALKAAQAMERQADNPLVQNLKGGIYLAQKDAVAARASFEKALKLDPAHLPALSNLEELDRMEHKAGAAQARYQAALTRSPRDAGLMEAMSRLALAQGKTGEARSWMERASAENPESLPTALHLAALYLRLGERDKALILARKLQAGHPSSADALALLGQAYVANGNYPDAADTYRRMAAAAPRNAQPLVRLASVQIAQQRHAQALDALHKALALEPGLFEARITEVNLLLSMGKPDHALAVAKAMQQREPGDAGGYKLEGDVLSSQGRHEGALKAYEKAFTLHPRGAALVQVATSLQRLRRQADADARIADWLRQHPADIPTRLYFASLKLMNNEMKAAIPHYEAVLKADPDNLAALNDLAWSHQRLGDGQALGYAQRALLLAPDNPAVLDTVGWIYLQQGELTRALPLLQKASALAPGAGEIQFHYGALLARSGDKKGARRALEKALAAGPGFARRAEAKALLATL